MKIQKLIKCPVCGAAAEDDACGICEKCWDKWEDFFLKPVPGTDFHSMDPDWHSKLEGDDKIFCELFSQKVEEYRKANDIEK